MKRLLLALLTIWAISVISFGIIQLPPGDYVTAYVAQLMSTGTQVTDEEANNLREQYGLDSPFPVQYMKWMQQIVKGNFGLSMEYQRPVTDVIGDRLFLTAALAFASVIFTWILAIPIEYILRCGNTRWETTCSRSSASSGWPVPNFLLALVLLYLRVRILQRKHRRAVLSRVRRRAVQHRQGNRPAEPPVAALHRAGRRGHGAADPRAARQSSR